MIILLVLSNKISYNKIYLFNSDTRINIIFKQEKLA